MPYNVFCLIRLPAGGGGDGELSAVAQARERWRRLLLLTYGLSSRLAGWRTPLQRTAADLEALCAAQMRVWRRRLAEREIRECVARRRVTWREVAAIMDSLASSAPVSADGIASDTIPGSAEEVEEFLELQCDDDPADEQAAKGDAAPLLLEGLRGAMGDVIEMALDGADEKLVAWQLQTRQQRLCAGGAASASAQRPPPKSKAWSRREAAADADSAAAAGDRQPQVSKQRKHKWDAGAEGLVEEDARDAAEGEPTPAQRRPPPLTEEARSGAAGALPAPGDRRKPHRKGLTRRVREQLENDGWCVCPGTGNSLAGQNLTFAMLPSPSTLLTPMPHGLAAHACLPSPSCLRRELQRTKKHVIFKRRVIDPATGAPRTQTFTASKTPSDSRTERNQLALLLRLNAQAAAEASCSSGDAAAAVGGA